MMLKLAVCIVFNQDQYFSRGLDLQHSDRIFFMQTDCIKLEAACLLLCYRSIVLEMSNLQQHCILSQPHGNPPNGITIYFSYRVGCQVHTEIYGSILNFWLELNKSHNLLLFSGSICSKDLNQPDANEIGQFYGVI